MSASRRRQPRADYWPGFVDAMATLLLVIIFLLSVFMLAQFFLSQEISGKDTALTRLNAQIAELTQLLALERAQSGSLEDQIAVLQASIQDVEGERDSLQGQLSALQAEGEGPNVGVLQDQLDEEQALSQRALARVELLNQQLTALRRQIAALESALAASESRDEESQARIADLGRRLNVALAQRVQELSRYRSDFFGRLRQLLSDRSNIQVVGDRFVFQSEVLFPSGSDELNPQGEGELDTLAAELIDLGNEIPDDIDWVLRVDGHTDSRPISGGRFRSNWDLSAARAISVVQHLIDQGVPPDRLVAAGFGEYQPLVDGETPEAYAQNRRIELKLTQR
ncbi:chemotaxis protein MotB [Amorphus orientalis]|uniref:Chemotaxis protein MotB n=1 Tax=Amorphus orientalis TaxID=649198 RepID=A0AAE3VQR7_9HYPH|nr:chemotaxis protein MotB [Amorphus orientalis]